MYNELLFPGPRNSLFGMNIVEAREIPRYQLPEEVMPGIPWPPGFRDKYNAIFRDLCGTTCLVPKGTVYVIQGHTAMMRREDIVKITNLI